MELKKPYWSLFLTYLETVINVNNANIEEIVTKFTKSIIYTAEKIIGYSNIKRNKPLRFMVE